MARFRHSIWLVFLALLAAAPAQARFLQTDPVGYQDDLDWYNYVQDDPTDKTDPTGKEGVDELQRVDPGFGGNPNTPDPPPDLNNLANAVDFGTAVATAAEIDASGGLAVLGPAEATEAEGHAIATELRAEAQAEIAQARTASEAGSLERGAKSLDKLAEDHEARAAAFKNDPTVRPGMEGQSPEVIAKQQEARYQHLMKEAAEFRKQAAEKRAQAQALKDKLAGCTATKDCPK